MANGDESSEKAKLEAQKLQLEIHELRRPFLKRPTSWLSMVAAAVAVGGFIGQATLSNIKVERALLDAAQKRQAADAEVKAANALADMRAAEADEAVRLRTLAETETNEARFLRARLVAEQRALRDQIENARRDLSLVENLVETLKSAGVEPDLVQRIAEALDETSESLGRTCSPEDASSYDKALTIDPTEVDALVRTHFPWGAPVYKGPDSDLVDVIQPWWVGGHSPSRKLPLWVGYRLEWTDPEISQREECWRPDPRFDADSMARLEDYRRSGFDRGHLVPRLDLAGSEAAMASAYIFTNLTPQAPRLNRGALVRLERRIRDWAMAHGRIYVVAGPIFDFDADGTVDSGWAGKVIGPGEIAVPTQFFRIVVRENVNGGPVAVGFVHPNDDSVDGRSDLQMHQVSVEVIERLTGMVFFPDLDPALSRPLKTQIVDLSEW